jgi:hypothetical protein
MEPAFERIRRNVGITLMVVLFVGFLTGVALFGRIVGDAVGTAYIGSTPGAEDLPPLPTGPPPHPEAPQTAIRAGVSRPADPAAAGGATGRQER